MRIQRKMKSLFYFLMSCLFYCNVVYAQEVKLVVPTGYKSWLDCKYMLTDDETTLFTYDLSSNEIKLWETSSNRYIASLHIQSDRLQCLKIEGELIYCLGQNGLLELWNYKTQTKIANYEIQEQYADKILIDNSKNLIFFVSSRNLAAYTLSDFEFQYKDELWKTFESRSLWEVSLIEENEILIHSIDSVRIYNIKNHSFETNLSEKCNINGPKTTILNIDRSLRKIILWDREKSNIDVVSLNDLKNKESYHFTSEIYRVDVCSDSVFIIDTSDEDKLLNINSGVIKGLDFLKGSTDEYYTYSGNNKHLLQFESSSYRNNNLNVIRIYSNSTFELLDSVKISSTISENFEVFERFIFFPVTFFRPNSAMSSTFPRIIDITAPEGTTSVDFSFDYLYNRDEELLNPDYFQKTIAQRIKVKSHFPQETGSWRELLIDSTGNFCFYNGYDENKVLYKLVKTLNNDDSAVVLKDFKVPKTSADFATFSPNNEFFAFSANGVMVLYDLKQEKQIFTRKIPSKFSNLYQLGNQHLYCKHEGGFIEIFDIKAKKWQKLKIPEQEVSYIPVQPTFFNLIVNDGLLINNDRSIFLVENNSEIKVIYNQAYNGIASSIKQSYLDPSGENLLFLRYDGKLVKCNLYTRKTDSLELGFIGNISIFFNSDTTFILNVSDMVGYEFNLATFDINFQFFSGKSGALVAVTPEGYYYGMKEDLKKFYFNIGGALYSFDQLDIVYNRPDILVKKIIGIDDEIIEIYHAAYLKRMNKLGYNTDKSTISKSLPEMTLVNLKTLPISQSEPSINLEFNAVDNGTSLHSYNIWINEVPVFGSQGVSLAKYSKRSFNKNIEIQLSNGKNKIEYSVTNSSGIESLRKPFYITYSPAKKLESKTHFIGIGIDKFQEPDHDLSYSVKDVSDLANAMKAKLGDQLTIDTLFNQNVSISNVQALKKRLLETNINDKVIISYSGHGLLSKEYDYYLSSYTVNFQQPEIGGIPYEVLEDLLDSIPARQKLLLIDACHSGEVDKDDFREMATVAGAKGILKSRGADAENTSTTNTVGLQNSFQLMQELFVNVQKGSGATIISAAAGDQFALEGGKLKNGFFTYAILQYIAKNQSVGINELKKYVYAEVERLSGGLQKPTSRIENLELDWRLW